MIFSLYRNVKDSPTGGHYECGTYETDATEDVVEEIVNVLEKENKIKILEFGESVKSILVARGYACEKFEVKRFGYSS